MRLSVHSHSLRPAIIAACIAVAATSSVNADLSWDSPATDLSAFGVGTNWLVLMFQDVQGDSALGTIIFNEDGLTAGGTGYSDDIFMGASYQTSTFEFLGATAFNESIPAGWQSTYSTATVYTVVLNATDWTGATQTRIFDATPHKLGATDPHTYTVQEPANAWQTVIPEPTTMAMLLAGLLGLFGLRRRFIA